MEIELTSDIEPSMTPTILELVYEASRPLYEFVYRDEAEARRALQVIWDAGVGEWAPPHTLVVMLDGEFSGLLGGLMADELSRAHMAASLALGRAGILSDKQRAARMRASIEALVEPQEGDFYFPVIGMLPAVRGTGYIPELFELCRQHAYERGARRIVFQASEDMPGVVRMYERTGHYRIGEGKASDPESGRELHYIHFAIDLGEWAKRRREPSSA